MGQPRTALIIGGGIIGVTSAYTLARDGWQVRLVEREAEIALGASWGNGRQLSYSHTNALANPGILSQLPGLLLGCDDAFRLSLRPEPHYLLWLLRLLGNSSGSAYRQNTLETLALAEQSRSAMNALLARHPIEFDRRKVGKLVLLRGEKEVRAAREIMELKRAAGLRQFLLSADEARAIEPALAQSTDPITAALHAPDDETGDCNAFARALWKLTAREFGAKLALRRQVLAIGRGKTESRVHLDNGDVLSAQQVVVANGHCAARLLRPLGYNLPIEPMKGYSFTAPIGNAPPCVSITDSKRRIVFTNIGTRMLVAGIAELGRHDREVAPDRLDTMIDAARASLPEAAVYSECDQGWAGFRPLTPNSQPLIRQLERGIAVNGGHGMLGWTLAMGSAERLSKLVAAR
ncbi:FAD-dependent oxidoreductase [Altererythrobacter arenosus]|uniref:FAD-dependent oxidoreductase n=1 Tax=Altererythrobacter arenosus TaxID=3032592 RepID=A0ABY8FN33_9SPHN|nr:FAD-dependent oxidoreductase [Altererythrobacter sp. CAU 1644]WFL76418.1 FAD-dependent oxidoreductase [Altererythrobacter sp. CAU 1644]